MASRYGSEVEIDPSAFVHDGVLLYGRVRVRAGASLWPHVVVRAELAHVDIGQQANIQDFVMIHVGYTEPTVIGAFCSVTHHCTIHGASIGDNCLIGVNATLMDGCEIGANSIVAGGAFLKERTVIPPNSIVMGAPGKAVKTRNNWIANRFNARLYARNARAYMRGDHRAWSGPEFERFCKDEMEALRAEFSTLVAAGKEQA
ncbi:MAG: gamma carbonic anhydrase family protein [Alphaproteobacteria bacterium]|nr:gamma carbonic anhydrase family protein [Alphaproteobacteria bacterium]